GLASAANAAAGTAISRLKMAVLMPSILAHGRASRALENRGIDRRVERDFFVFLRVAEARRRAPDQSLRSRSRGPPKGGHHVRFSTWRPALAGPDPAAPFSCPSALLPSALLPFCPSAL